MATKYQRELDKLKYEEFSQQSKEAQQQFEQDNWAYGQDVFNLNRNVQNQAIERNIARSTIPKSDISRGMIPLNQQIKIAGQNLQNTLSSIDRAKRAYALYVKQRDYRAPKPLTDQEIIVALLEQQQAGLGKSKQTQYNSPTATATGIGYQPTPSR